MSITRRLFGNVTRWNDSLFEQMQAYMIEHFMDMFFVEFREIIAVTKRQR